MAVMVTGTGFVGSYVVRDLLDAGEDVVLFGFFGGLGEPASLDLPDLGFLDHLVGGGLLDRVTALVGDITDLEAVSAAVDGCGVRSIVHLASKVTSASAANPASAIRVNAEGTANIFEAASRSRLDKVVWASSIAVFGPRSMDASGTISDDSPYDPRDLYGGTKVLCEQLARSYHDNTGLNVTGLRLSRVYGFGEHVKAGRGGGSAWLMRLLHDAAVGRAHVIVPFGDRSLDFHYVEDVADAFVRALRTPGAEGQSYLTHGDYRPVADAFEFVRRLLPDADMTLVAGDADLAKNYSIAWGYQFDARHAETELGIHNRFGMEAGVYRTVNQNRLLVGLPAISEPASLTKMRA